MDTCLSAEKVSTINCQLEEYDSGLKRQYDLIEGLYSKLQAVVINEPKGEVCEKDTPSATSSGVAFSLEEKNTILRRHNEKIKSLINSIDL